MTISINLDDLTQEHIDRCAPHIGECRYDAPCIIGTLSEDLGPIASSIDVLVGMGRVSMPDEQREEAHALQCAFDGRYVGFLIELLAKRGLKWPSDGRL